MPTTEAPLLGEPLSVELMNTIWADSRGVYDALSTPADLAGWLCAAAAARVVLRHLDESTVREYRALRDALRVLAARATDDERPIAAAGTRSVANAITVVNRCGAAAPTWNELSWPAGGVPTARARSAGSVEHAVLARIAQDAVAIFGSDRRLELRACYAPGCVLYFVRDHPRREWCSPACGNRARVARYYARHRKPAAGQ